MPTGPKHDVAPPELGSRMQLVTEIRKLGRLGYTSGRILLFFTEQIAYPDDRVCLFLREPR